jgi:hypothetical protein
VGPFVFGESSEKREVLGSGLGDYWVLWKGLAGVRREGLLAFAIC